MGEKKPEPLDFVKDFQEYLTQQTHHVNMISGSVSGDKEAEALQGAGTDGDQNGLDHPSVEVSLDENSGMLVDGFERTFDGKLKCRYCNYASKGTARLIEHIRIHTEKVLWLHWFGFVESLTHEKICHMSYQQQKWYPSLLKVLFAQSCSTLCHPMDCGSPGSSVHGISQPRILEWVAIPFSRGIFQPRDQIQVSCIAGRFFTSEPPGKPLSSLGESLNEIHQVVNWVPCRQYAG
uniref:IKAROS family zinc finger 5 n=1 Tax=Bos mutus grunniens TaxID=30521 RepID=A0A8B9YUL5_BOSMU